MNIYIYISSSGKMFSLKTVYSLSWYLFARLFCNILFCFVLFFSHLQINYCQKFTFTSHLFNVIKHLVIFFLFLLILLSPYLYTGNVVFSSQNSLSDWHSNSAQTELAKFVCIDVSAWLTVAFRITLTPITHQLKLWDTERFDNTTSVWFMLPKYIVCL